MKNMYITKWLHFDTQENKDLAEFVQESARKFLSGDFGKCKEPEKNQPGDSLGVYENKNGVVIWIVEDPDHITILYPEEY